MHSSRFQAQAIPLKRFEQDYSTYRGAEAGRISDTVFNWTATLDRYYRSRRRVLEDPSE